jgi:acetyl-CoA carboxylase alpha subunit
VLQAATVLKITGPELIEQGIMDEIIPEPLGGSHRDPAAVYPMIKKALMDTWHNKWVHPSTPPRLQFGHPTLSSIF